MTESQKKHLEFLKSSIFRNSSNGSKKSKVPNTASSGGSVSRRTRSSGVDPFATQELLEQIVFKSADSDRMLADLVNSSSSLFQSAKAKGEQKADQSSTGTGPTNHTVFSSSAWVPTLEAGHVDVDYKAMFPRTHSTGEPSTTKTDFSSLFYSQLAAADAPTKATTTQAPKSASSSTKKPAKTRKSQRSSSITHTKKYITDTFTDRDVLMGRGGRTNNHVGNQRYLEMKLLIQPRYRAATKDDKTAIAQELVDAVHAQGGRFLRLDSTKMWYEVNNLTARKKASQTLREDNTADKRAAKRAKYSRNLN